MAKVICVLFLLMLTTWTLSSCGGRAINVYIDKVKLKDKSAFEKDLQNFLASKGVGEGTEFFLIIHGFEGKGTAELRLANPKFTKSFNYIPVNPIIPKIAANFWKHIENKDQYARVAVTFYPDVYRLGDKDIPTESHGKGYPISSLQP